MKHLLKIYTLVVASLLVFTSCGKDDDYQYDFRISYGTILLQEGSNVYEIVLDNGTRLNVVQNLVAGTAVTQNQRVIADYTLLSGNTSLGSTSYDVRLNRLYKVLSKVPVAQSWIDEDKIVREAEIGTDRINVVESWFGGNYLNVNFVIGTSNTAIKHFINVVRDDVSPRPEPTGGVLENDTLYLTMRHNAYADANRYSSFGRVSFDISGLVPQGKTKMPVKLTWTEYSGAKRWDSGTYQIGGYYVRSGAESTTASYLNLQ